MEKLYEDLFFKYVYYLLNLREEEEELKSNNVVPYYEKNTISNFSEFFGLLNAGSFSEFTGQESEMMNKISSLKMDDISFENQEYKFIVDFIESTYSKFFFSNINTKYMFYGPESFEYYAPSDAIALGFYYKQFANYENDERMLEIDNIINRTLNKIQFSKATSKNMKLAVIKYNEFVINKNFIEIDLDMIEEKKTK